MTQVVELSGIVNPDDAPTPQAPSWRDSIEIHPAADLFPPMNKAELAELGKDIRANGLVSPIALWRASEDAQAELLDGRNRLDAIEGELGRPVRIASHTFRSLQTWHLETDDDRILIGGVEPDIVVLPVGTDPYAYVTSVNLHRRHLTAEQKRDVIAKLIKAAPEKSNRQIAKQVEASHPHIAKIRAEMEKAGDVETVTTSIDTKGRRQQAKKKAKVGKSKIAKASSDLPGEPLVAKPATEGATKPAEAPDTTMPAASAPTRDGIYTHANYTWGAKIAMTRLEDRIEWMRALQGAEMLAIIRNGLRAAELVTLR